MSNTLKASILSVVGVMGAHQWSRADTGNELTKSEAIRQERIAQSEQFSGNKAITRMPSVDTNESMTTVLWKFVSQRGELKPSKPLPYQPINPVALEQRSEALRVTWLGHSSLFVEMANKRLLIDPVFEYASPWIAQRLFLRNVSAPIAREDLPLPDAIVISHDHYDHLEESTARYFAAKGVEFYVPLGVGRHLENWGVAPQQIKEFDWWESANVDGVELTATPANHNSGRKGFDANTTLWCSWVIRSDKHSVFYSGDTAYDTHFKQIGDKFGSFDLAFIEVAANVKEGKGYPVENWGHMQAKHTMQAYVDLNADMLFPVHWSTYELFAHRWDEPINDLIAESEKTGAHLVTPMVGETIDYKNDINTTFWWKTPEIKLASAQLGYQN
ncbi:MBL fold metallo-hydrolase [Vibrio sonorensis]|uniref:MBL fold metallo-hydrolase n=1 Tax=Vibrio sonorensis TaxID=1004316 RepID=UPI000AEFF6A5|nr:MBL fold metallo-hydrolase [Vibrio sonorensis]